MADTLSANRKVELQRGVLKILLDHPEGMQARDVLRRMEQTVPPTSAEKADYASTPGVQRFPKIIRFATIAPVKAGWMVKEKGKWYITEEGKNAYAKLQDPEAFRRELRRLYYQWLELHDKDGASIDSEDEEESIAAAKNATVAATLEEAEENAWAQIEQHVKAMQPYDLQKLVAALLRAMGYHIAWVSPPGPDKGIDIVAHNDPLGTTKPRIKVQVKRRADKINVDGLRSFMAVLGDGDVGIFVSTGGFTSDAESEARTKETRKLTLVDLEKLVELWIEHYDKIAEAEKLLLPLKSVFYLAPPND